MRHPEREIEDPETITGLLETSAVGRVATINRKGFPVVKPVNFLYRRGKIYFHSSPRGEKIRDIRRNSYVCFEVDEPIAFVSARGSACSANYFFRSVLIKGKAVLVKGETRKLEVIKALMEKYQPEGGMGEVSEEVLKKTAIVEITVEEMTAKERLG